MNGSRSIKSKHLRQLIRLRTALDIEFLKQVMLLEPSFPSVVLRALPSGKFSYRRFGSGCEGGAMVNMGA